MKFMLIETWQEVVANAIAAMPFLLKSKCFLLLVPNFVKMFKKDLYSIPCAVTQRATQLLLHIFGA